MRSQAKRIANKKASSKGEAFLYSRINLEDQPLIAGAAIATGATSTAAKSRGKL